MIFKYLLSLKIFMLKINIKNLEMSTLQNKNKGTNKNFKTKEYFLNQKWSQKTKAIINHKLLLHLSQPLVIQITCHLFL